VSSLFRRKTASAEGAALAETLEARGFFRYLDPAEAAAAKAAVAKGGIDSIWEVETGRHFLGADSEDLAEGGVADWVDELRPALAKLGAPIDGDVERRLRRDALRPRSGTCCSTSSGSAEVRYRRRASMSRSYVVTGGGRGVGRSLVERLLGEADSVVAIELDPAALAWADSHPAGRRVIAVVGDAADEDVAEQAADLAQAAGPLAGWVNNAAVFRDSSIHSASTREVLDLIALHPEPAVAGCATAAATSSGRPTRPIGCSRRISSSIRAAAVGSCWPRNAS